jgi:CheY-like chemotaxis protein
VADSTLGPRTAPAPRRARSSTSATAPAHPADLPTRQIAAIDAFNRARRTAQAASAAALGSREMRLDAARRLDVLRRQHEAVVATTDEALRTSRDLLRASSSRAVVVHHNPWFTRKVSDALADEGIVVLAQLDNGADAVGMVVAEQPDLLLLEDPLPMMTAEQVVHEVRTYSPHTFVAVQADASAIGQLLGAGAGSVFTRHITPVSLARDLAGVLHSRN